MTAHICPPTTGKRQEEAGGVQGQAGQGSVRLPWDTEWDPRKGHRELAQWLWKERSLLPSWTRDFDPQG